MVRRILCGLGLLMVVLFPLQRTYAAPAVALLRIVHAAPMLGGVDVFVDGTRVLADMQIRDVSHYLSIPSGQHTIAVAPSAKGTAASIVTQVTTLAPNHAYTLAAVGLNTVSAQLYTDDLSTPPSGKARVRVIHASPDAPSADVDVVGGPTLVQNLAFPHASNYLLVDPGNYNLQVVAVGDNSVFLRLPNTTVKPGIVYDVIAIGRLANIQVSVATYMPAMQSASPPSQAMLPHTGASDIPQWSLAGVVLIALGAALLASQRRRTARRR